MTTALGPWGPNFTTTRPSQDSDASSGVDTWAKDCSAAGAKDGTFLTASFFNVIIAQLREAIRQAGIPLDNSDDEMLYKAIQAIAVSKLACDWGVEYNTTTSKIELLLGKGTLPVLT